MEFAFSCAAGQVVCLDCHTRVASPSPGAARWRPPKPPPPHKDWPGGYAWFVGKVWTGLQARTPDMPVFHLEASRIAAYCPVGCGGVLAIRFIDTRDGPEAIVESSAGVGFCSMGCTAERIMGALL